MCTKMFSDARSDSYSVRKKKALFRKQSLRSSLIRLVTINNMSKLAPFLTCFLSFTTLDSMIDFQ